MPETLSIWWSNDFEGVYPVGTAAVIVAHNASEAQALLRCELERRQLNPTRFATVHELIPDKPSVVILNDGDY